MAEGVAALVAEGRRVGRLTHPETVAHDRRSRAGTGAHRASFRAACSASATRPPPASRASDASVLVAEPGHLALRVPHGRRDDITPGLRLRRSGRARRPPPGDSRSPAAGAGRRDSRGRAGRAPPPRARARTSRRVRALHGRAQDLARGRDADDVPRGTPRARAPRRGGAPSAAGRCPEHLERAHDAHAGRAGGMRAADSGSTRASSRCIASPRRGAPRSQRGARGRPRRAPAPRTARGAARAGRARCRRPRSAPGRVPWISAAAARASRAYSAAEKPCVRIHHVEQVVRDRARARRGSPWRCRCRGRGTPAGCRRTRSRRPRSRARRSASGALPGGGGPDDRDQRSCHSLQAVHRRASAEQDDARPEPAGARSRRSVAGRPRTIVGLVLGAERALHGQELRVEQLVEGVHEEAPPLRPRALGSGSAR